MVVWYCEYWDWTFKKTEKRQNGLGLCSCSVKTRFPKLYNKSQPGYTYYHIYYQSACIYIDFDFVVLYLQDDHERLAWLRNCVDFLYHSESYISTFCPRGNSAKSRWLVEPQTVIESYNLLYSSYIFYKGFFHTSPIFDVWNKIQP